MKVSDLGWLVANAYGKYHRMRSIARAWKWILLAPVALAAGTAGAALMACGLEEGGFGASAGTGMPNSGNSGDSGNGSPGADSGGGTTNPGKGDPACVPAPEICNGRDDDCNGVPDDGCPQCDGPDGRCTMGMTFAGAGGSGLLGYPDQGGSFDDTCGEGEAVVGVDAQSGEFVDQVKTWCVKLEVRRETSSPQYKYFVAWQNEPQMRFPAHGKGGPNSATVQCKKPKVAVGLSLVGHLTGSRISKVEFTCAEIDITGLPGVPRLELSGSTPEKVEGTRVAQGTAIPTYNAAPGSIFHGLFGEPPGQGDFINALGTRDQALSITPLPTIR